jgi:hypothetical protein
MQRLQFRPSSPEAFHVKRHDKPVSEGRIYVREMASQFGLRFRLPRKSQDSVTCRKAVAWDRRLYFPSEWRHAVDFFARKIQRLRSGSNPRSWVPETTEAAKWVIVLTSGLYVGHYINNLFSLRVPNTTTPSRGAQAIFRANLLCFIPHFLNHSHPSYLLAYEDGTNGVSKRWHLNCRRWENSPEESVRHSK